MDQRRTVLRAGHVRVSDEAVLIGAPKTEGEPKEPTVQLIRDGDEIRTIQVTCSCGERIGIRCEYA